MEGQTKGRKDGRLEGWTDGRMTLTIRWSVSNRLLEMEKHRQTHTKTQTHTHTHTGPHKTSKGRQTHRQTNRQAKTHTHTKVECRNRSTNEGRGPECTSAHALT